MADRRLLLVHAHPDDETINNGGTMARYAAAGVEVHLVTCTRGEQGEVIPPSLAHLAADASDSLGPYREGELAAALAALGVGHHAYLGAPGSSYRDSGMAYAPDGTVVPAPDPRPDAFALAELDGAADWLARHLVRVAPQVVVTYDPSGGYGHPDHVQAHRVTLRAVELAAGRPDGWDVPKLYWVVGSPDSATASVDITGFLGAKVAALRAHATQIAVSPDGSSFALSNEVSYPISGAEHYRLVRGTPSGPYDAAGREVDLFAGT